jgi:hypothetical protein
MRMVVVLGALALVLVAGASAQPNPGINGEIAFERSGAVMAFDPRNGTTRELVAGAQPAWSPKGGIAFVRDNTIYLASADGSNARALVAGQWPAWSPDGSRLAFVRGQQLFMFDLDQAAETPLTGAGADIVAPAWSPDGSEVAYGANGAIFSVALDGAPSRDLVAGGRASGGPAWSPDGTQLAYVGLNGQVYVTSRDGSATKQLTFTLSGATGVAQRPAWSPDGTLIAWAQGPDICVADPTGKVARLTRTQATATAQAVVSSSPDWQSTTGPPYKPEAAPAGARDAPSCDRRAGARVDILPGNVTPQVASIRAPADLAFVNHLPTMVIVSFAGHRAAVQAGAVYGFPTVPGEFSFTVTGYPDGVPRRGRVSAESAGRASIEQHAAIRYGTSTVLTGAAVGVPGEPVVISAKPYGSSRARRIATVQPAGGRWRVSVAPRVTTLYHVSYAGAPVERRLRVTPALRVSRAGNAVRAALTPAGGVRGKRLFLFRLAGRGWTEAASARIGASGQAAFTQIAPGRYYVGFDGNAAYWGTASEPFNVG